MIKKLIIKNFKSIKDLKIDCRKINLFIGEPNAGKSNILEALGLLSWSSYQNRNLSPSLREFVRFQDMPELFYDRLLNNDVEIKIENESGFRITSINNGFILKDIRSKKPKRFVLDYKGTLLEEHSKNLKVLQDAYYDFVKYYKFTDINDFFNSNPFCLRPPNGDNLVSVVMGNLKLREIVRRLFKNFGFAAVFTPQEFKLEFQKQQNDVFFKYSYVLASDTIKRILFYTVAIESNKNSTLVFEEPESHSFPYYTKYLGEKIAFNESNQYFIATHNPYLLLAILEKAKKTAVNVFVTYSKNYQTKVKCLSSAQISDLMNFDPFLNINRFFEKD